jgi:hypothetical protein
MEQVPELPVAASKEAAKEIELLLTIREARQLFGICDDAERAAQGRVDAAQQAHLRGDCTAQIERVVEYRRIKEKLATGLMADQSAAT